MGKAEILIGESISSSRIIGISGVIAVPRGRTVPDDYRSHDAA